MDEKRVLPTIRENMEKSLRAINALYQVRCGFPLDLQLLSNLVGEHGRHYRGRPTMLTCRMLKKRVQFFPNGTIQILGGDLTPHLRQQLMSKICALLKLCNYSLLEKNFFFSVSNFVFHLHLNQHVKFKHIPCGKDFSYEPELFPAALISKWQPCHVTLFPNGKAMLTGVQSRDSALYIIDELISFLYHNDCICGL